MTRRRFTAAIAAILPTSGCVGRRWWEDDTAATEQNPESNPDGDESGGDNRNESRADRDEGESTNSTESTDADPNSSENSSETTGNETDGGQEQEPEIHNESELHPDDDDLEPSGDYDRNSSGGTKDITERPRDHITISDETATVNDDGTVTYTAIVRNVSEDPIDVIELFIEYYVDGTYQDGSTAAVLDLGAGDEKTAHATSSRLYAAPAEIEANRADVTLYDYTNDGS